MKKDIKYRSFQRKDIHSLVSVIKDSWNYDELFSANTASQLAHTFLYAVLIRKSFSQVALLDGEAVGIIIGDLKNNRKSLSNLLYYPPLIWYVLQLLFSKEGRKILVKYTGSAAKINKELLMKINQPKEVELAFFAVCPKTQGIGVGSHLYKYFINTLKEKPVKTFYLYTDTTCNFGFYDHKGLLQAASIIKKMDFPEINEIAFYIYTGELR